MKDFFELPTTLPVPQDDGACDHLWQCSIPAVTLLATSGREVNLKEEAKLPTVFFFYPRTGRPDEPIPAGWDDTPGARGCTPQSCGFRDLQSAFKNLGFQVFGVSTQPRPFQQEFVSRMHIPFEVLSDSDFKLTRALNLPTFVFGAETLLKRMAWVVEHGTICKVFYPVFPPGENAQTVLQWIASRHQRKNVLANNDARGI